MSVVAIRILGITGLLAVVAVSFAASLWDTAAEWLTKVWESSHPASFLFVRTAVEQYLPGLSTSQSLRGAVGLVAVLCIVLIGLRLYHQNMRRRTAAKTDVEAEPEPEGLTTARRPAMRASPRSELAQALRACQSAFISVGVFSGFSNVLMLTGAFFMLQVYDRVLPSRSVPTLVALATLVAVLFAFLAILDMIKSRILVRIGASLDDALSTKVYDALVRLPLRAGNRGEGLQPLRDLDAVRTFLSGPGPTALFDLPWMPLYIGIVFAFHTALGLTATGGAILLVALTLLTEVLARKPMTAASRFALTRNSLAEASRRNAEVLAAMGMAGRLSARWSEANHDYRASHQRASDVTGGFGSVSKALRMMLQSTVLGIGAYLVINQLATAGIIIAAAILVARALAPIDLAIAQWKGFVAARQSWKRLNQLLHQLPERADPLALPAPVKSLAVEHVTAVPPGEKKVVVHDVSFKLESGQGLGIIGPSASGKSSLVRMIVGAWTPARGRIRLDGAALDQWSPEALGSHIGYLPQDVELFAGTVAENVARFDPDAPSETIIKAAQAAGVHELIVSLPQGYETEIGEAGQVLSAGQRQRIALARALYDEPFLVVLDEPNSNLDSEGETALTQAIQGVRERDGIVIVVAHRPSALASVDLVMVMAQGSAINIGPKDEVLSKVVPQKRPSRRTPLTVVPEAVATKS
jgi:ATP-binding cassette, subfamily C, type I secretion system permease/ATPase